MTTFNTGIPDFQRNVLTPFGIGQVFGFREDGAIDFRSVDGREHRIPGWVEWRELPPRGANGRTRPT